MPIVMFLRFLCIALIAVLLSPSIPVYAAVQWSLSAVEGFYFPVLYDLNKSLTSPFVEIGPRKTDARPTPYPVIYQGTSPVMPEMSPKAPNFGLQVQADINPRYTVVIGNSIGVLESQARDIRRFFVGFNIDSPRETRFSLVLNQVWLGLRRNMEVGKGDTTKNRPRLYGEVGIMGITKAVLTSNVWLHVYAPDEGFDFYKVTSTESTGSGYATYLGSGGEYFLNKWLSVGVDVQYVFGGVKDIRFTRFFTVDPLEAGLIRPGDPVVVTDLERGRRVPLFLKLDGWDLKGMIRFYF